MANIRRIKAEFFRHELLQQLERENPKLRPMLLFAGLWTISDNSGVFEWRPAQIRLDVLPFLDYDVEKSLNLLVDAMFVKKYQSAGKTFGCVINFNKHQKMPPARKFDESIVDEIFGHWRITVGHVQAKLLPKRREVILRTLDSGYDVWQVKLAIEGLKKSKWHMERAYDGLEIALRPSNIDRFIKMAGMTNDELSRATREPRAEIDWGDTTWAEEGSGRANKCDKYSGQLFDA